MKRATCIVIAVFLASLFLANAFDAFAMEKPKGFPKRAVEVVIRSGPGSGSEMFGRAILEDVEKTFGVPVKFTFKPGAGGAIATAYFMDQPADGHTLEEASPSMVINVATGRAKYKLDDFIWLFRGAHDISALHTRVDSPFQTLKDIQDYCKKNPKVRLTVAGADAMTFDHLWIEVLNKRGNICLKFVPFPKSSLRRASFQAGHTTFESDELIDMEGLYKAGISKPLVIGYTKRIGKYPDVQCTGELGVENYLGRWRGFVLKKGTPEPIVKYWEWAFKKSFGTQRMKDYLQKELGHDRTVAMGRDEYTKEITADLATFTEIAKDLGWIK